jgi:DNA-binding response OmpR family regulator
MTVTPRVLIADDDRDFLDAIAAAVHHLGADVIRVTSGGELIERMADEGPFDLVITDISMPWMSGLQALQAARTAGVETPVIVMTALRDEKLPERVAAIGGGAAVLLQKPFELSALEAKVTELLQPR